MQNTVTCPVCGSDLPIKYDSSVDALVIDKEAEKPKRYSYPPRYARSQMMMNVIYILIGALLALAGVSLPGCTDLEVVCPECDTMEETTDQDSETATSETDVINTSGKTKDTATDKKPDTGSGEGERDSATDEPLDSATDEPLESDLDTDTTIQDTATHAFQEITDDCEAMRDFFSDCYWNETSFTGPTYEQITDECSMGNIITESLSNWHLCWKIPENDCVCPAGASFDNFQCQQTKCEQWTACMTECGL